MMADKLGVELLAAPPFRHRVALSGNVVATATAANVDGKYYIGGKQNSLRPSIGVGVNYNTFFNEDFNDFCKSAGLSILNLKISGA